MAAALVLCWGGVHAGRASSGTTATTPANSLTSLGRRHTALGSPRGRKLQLLVNEGTGIPPEVLDLLHEAVEIPMLGTGHSLNVAVAGSLVLYKLAGLL